MATMFDHLLDVVGGPVPGTPYALMKSAKIGTGQTAAHFVAGRVVTLDSDGNFVIGAAAPAAGGASLPMPMFLVNSYNDFDVAGDTGNLVGANSDGTNSPKLSAIVASGGFEIETTEFDANDAATLVPNRPVTAETDGILDADTAIAGTPKTIVGIVSGAKAASHRSSTNYVVRIWTTCKHVFATA